MPDASRSTAAAMHDKAASVRQQASHYGLHIRSGSQEYEQARCVL